MLTNLPNKLEILEKKVIQIGGERDLSAKKKI
jgi:hypothetical protein